MIESQPWGVSDRELYERLRALRTADVDAAVASVVDVAGAAYRRPGAKLVAPTEGDALGAITAGCLDGPVAKLAAEARRSGEMTLETFDLTGAQGLGVGCNGVIDVLLEPLDETYRPAVEAFDAGADVAVLTVLSENAPALDRGDRAYYRPHDGQLTLPDGTTADEWPADALADPAGDLAERGRSGVLSVERGDTTLEVFVDGLAAPAELVVFGTGHDVGPVTELAERNDFRVTVVGFRGAVDLESRFPAAHRTVTTSPGTISEDLELGKRTYAVVMTHNFVDDRLTVETLLDSPAPYIGLMGPHDRFEEMLEEFETEGTTYTAADLEPLYTPIGLDLGGGSPYQIAHSIVAEVLAVENDRSPRHLTEREGHIHDRVEVSAAGK